jgi:hypothetical protein
MLIDAKSINNIVIAGIILQVGVYPFLPAALDRLQPRAERPTPQIVRAPNMPAPAPAPPPAAPNPAPEPQPATPATPVGAEIARTEPVAPKPAPRATPAPNPPQASRPAPQQRRPAKPPRLNSEQSRKPESNPVEKREYRGDWLDARPTFERPSRFDWEPPPPRRYFPREFPRRWEQAPVQRSWRDWRQNERQFMRDRLDRWERRRELRWERRRERW